MIMTDIMESYCAEYENLLRLAAAILADAHAAYDIVQNISIKILEGKFSGIKATAHIPYLRKSVRNESLDFLRKRNRSVITNPEELIDRLSDTTDFSRVEIKLWVDAYFVKESAEIREAIIMHYIDGFTFDQLSKMLGIKAVTLRSKFKRIMDALPKEKRNTALFLLLLCNI
jgi:RNA polymerase sigma-70 factor (ECF subfamily)